MATRAVGPRLTALAPLALLLAYAVVFASAALGLSLLAYDDHPGQLYRVWHVVRLGPAPWAWNGGWWTGYPELQFYPPGLPYAAALLHLASFDVLGVEGAYQLMLWLAYLAPGVTAWLALRRAVGNGWLAVPGAFVALTLSLWPALMSGVEGGVRVGMAPARLAWALLPLLALALARWSEDRGAFPTASVIPLTAAIVLTHPAHLPAALVLIALAALAVSPHGPRLRRALGGLVIAALVTGVWTLPLLVHLDNTRALAWGTLTPATVFDTLRGHPLVAVLAVLAVVALRVATGPYTQMLARAPWVLLLVVALDALVLEPLGVAWLPADRVADGFWLALVLAGGVGAGRLLQQLVERRGVPEVAAALGAVLVAIALSMLGRDTLTLSARASLWPSYPAIERGLRLPALWAALSAAPEGRVLFVRSGVPLVYGTEWWRPHTHVTALTPLTTGRAIVNGTFTHPSPIAALLYRGDAGPGPIRQLVERLDGQSLFGRPLETLDASTFNTYAQRLGVSAVVALEDDLSRLPALADNPRFPRRTSEPPFVIWLGTPAALPPPLEPGPWRMTLEAPPGEWASARVAYYPLWRAHGAGVALDTRRGQLGDLEVRLPAGRTALELSYEPGPVEWAGVGLTALGLLAWLATAWRRTRQR